MLSASTGYTDARAYTEQQEIAAPVLASTDAQEGARAFAEKRAPLWRGSSRSADPFRGTASCHSRFGGALR